MFRIPIITILLMSCHLINSQEVHVKVTTPDVYEGMRAEISCEFVNVPQVKTLLWKNVQDTSGTKLICSDKCREYDGFKLSRIGNTITLVIEHANVSAPRWECMNIAKTYSKFADLNITALPELTIKINKAETSYSIITSCSSVDMNVSCTLKEKFLQVEDLKREKCSNPVLSYFTGIIKPISGKITCTVQRNDKTASYTLDTDVMGDGIIVGIVVGVVAAIIVIIGGVFYVYRKHHYASVST